MKYNQAQNMHLLCFDPVYPRNESVNQYNQDVINGKTALLEFKPSRYMKMIHYGGCPELFNVEDGASYNEDGTVTLSYFAPNAKVVQVRYRLHNYKNAKAEYRREKGFYETDYVNEDMSLDEDGYWRKTINPGVGYHSIYYLVDGLATINQQGPYMYDGDGIRNIIDIPDDPDTQIQDVPHGSITRELYFSNETGRYRNCWVYLPPSYAKSDKTYPTLYLQHGGSQNETSWFAAGKLDIILDNLIARNEAEEMIVVCNNGYVYRDAENGQFYEGRLDNVIINECMPYIESKYRVSRDRRDRAAAGLSMGGGHARRLGLGHADIFANCGMFSSGECFPTVTDDMDFTELLSDAEKFNDYMDVIVVACGNADPRFDRTLLEVSAYQEKGFHIEFIEYIGQHEWNVWRYCAKDFVKKIFRKKAKNEL